jgi:hypothetical protein
MNEPVPINMEVIIAEEELAVYVKFTGFDTTEFADEWADKLVEELPLYLFDSQVKH